MATLGGNKRLEDMSDKEFYEKVKIGKINYDSLSKISGFIVLDRKFRIVSFEENPDRAYSRAIINGCSSPRVLNSESVAREVYEEHNKRLEKALSE